MSTTKRLARHGSVYLLGNILQRSASFIMLPIYTHYLTPADYGVLELISMVIDFVAIVFGLRVADAVFRFYAKYESDRDKNEVITTSMGLILVLNLVGVALIWGTAGPLSQVVFGGPGQARLLMLFSLTLVTQSTVSIPMVFLKARQKSLTFLGFSLSKLLLRLGLNIYFIVFLGMKVEGVIYSALISGFAMSSVLCVYTLYVTGLHFSRPKASEIVRFSAPLVGAALLAFYFTFGDRYFLRVFAGTDAVGVYSLAYRFGFLLPFMVQRPFSSFWNSEMYHVAARENGVETLQNVFLFFSTAMIFFVVGICVFIREFLMIMSAPDFWPAAQVVPLVMAAYLFQGWTYYGTLGILLKERTIERTYGNILTAIIITPGYVLLIPLYGAMGAALATFVAFAFRCWYLNWRSNRLFNMHLPWGRMVPALALSTGTVLASKLGPEALVSGLVFDCAIMLGFAVLYFLLPILPTEMKHTFYGILLRPRKAALYLK
jgi:O-antigen/teichoic acid export membrane protein